MLAWVRDLTRGNAETMLGKGGVRFSFIRKRLLDHYPASRLFWPSVLDDTDASSQSRGRTRTLLSASADTLASLALYRPCLASDHRFYKGAARAADRMSP
jgi:hypothetical protein